MWQIGAFDLSRSAPPVVANDGTIYFNARSNLVALSRSGQVKWSFTADDSLYSSVSIGPDGSIFLVSSEHLYCLNSDGSLKWKLQLGEYHSMQAPAVARDGTLFVASADPKVTAVGPDGDVKWVFEVPKKGDFRMPQSWNGMKKIIRERFGFAKPILVSRPLLAPDGTLYVGFAQQYGSIYALSTGKKPFAGK